MHIVLKIVPLIKYLNLEKINCSSDCGAEQSVSEKQSMNVWKRNMLFKKKSLFPPTFPCESVQVSNTLASAQPFQFMASQSICWLFYRLKMPQARHEEWSTYKLFQELLTSVRTLRFKSGLLHGCKYQVVNFTTMTDPLTIWPLWPLVIRAHLYEETHRTFQFQQKIKCNVVFNQRPKR